MMLQNLKSIVLCTVLICLTGSVAQAGLVSADFLDQSPGMSAVAAPLDEDVRQEPNDTPQTLPTESAVLSNLGSFSQTSGTSAGMNGGGFSSASSGSIAIDTQLTPAIQPQLIARYLSEEASLMTPTAFLEQVFRPPR